MAVNRSKTLIHHLPKAELHLHIEGTLEPEMMFEMAKRNRLSLRFKSPKALREAYAFNGLQSFLDLYYEGVSVLLNEQDFYEMTYAYLKKAAQQNVRHAELFFDPQSHTHRNIPFETFMNGMHQATEDARKNLEISSKLILCFLRHLSEQDAMKTLEEALPYKKWFVAVGLDSSELGHPPAKFRDVFATAKKEGLLAVAHAGEEGPPDYIWQSLKLLDTLRIDHGVRCMEDPSLVDELVKRKIPLTVCPLSNIKLHVFKDLKSHNFKAMLERGLKVTINSDDPAYFRGYVNENYETVTESFHLTPDDLYTIAKNSFEASFVEDHERKKWIQELDQTFSTYARIS